MELTFLLDKQTIKRSDRNTIAAKAKNYVRARFTPVSSDWAQPITALFNDVKQPLDEENTCVVPWEVLEKPGVVRVSAFCGDGVAQVHTTTLATFTVEATGYTETTVEPGEPSPDVYIQILNKADNAEKLASKVSADAAAGKFTPKRGVDYWTQDDQAAIKADLTDATNAANQAADDAVMAAEQASAQAARASNAADIAKAAGETALANATAAADASSAANAAAKKANDAGAQAQQAAKKAQAAAGEATSAAAAALEAATIAESNQPRRKTSGELVHVTDALAKARPDLVVTQGKTSQNLWKQKKTIGTHKGVTFISDENGSVKASGTATDNYATALEAAITGDKSLISGKEYTLSATGSDNRFIAEVEFYKNGGRTTVFTVVNSKGTTFTCPEYDTIGYKLYMGERNGRNEVDTTIYPMLVKGSQPQPWTPSGLTCIESDTLEIRGKNLLEKYFLISEDAQPFHIVLSGAFEPPSSGNVTISFVAPNGYRGYFNEHIIYTPIKGTGGKTSITFDASLLKKSSPDIYNQAQGAWILVKNDKGNTVPPAFKDIQLEIGSTATPYEPYVGASLPIDLQGETLCKIPHWSGNVYDELRITKMKNGKQGHVEIFKKTIAIVGTKNKQWQYGGQTSTGAHRYYFDFNGDIAGFDIGGQYTFPLSHFNQWGNAPVGSCYMSENRFWVFVSAKTIEEFLQNIPESGYLIIGELTTPQIIDLGYIDLPALPESTANVWSSTNLPTATTELGYIQDINAVIADLTQQILSTPTK